MSVISKNNSLHHYIWGENCEGWNLVDNADLSVKLEQMPAGTSETRHYHKSAQQFFYILKGTAHFELNGEQVIVNESEGIHIEPGTTHKILNLSAAPLEFLLCSQPSTALDRINCEGS